MPTVTRKIRTDRDRAACIALINHKPLPITVRIKDGEDRSSDQNRLQWLWMGQIADQLGDRTKAETQAYCKLTFGIPILYAESEKFRYVYDLTIRNLTYEEKLKVLEGPLFAVTSEMSVPQMTEYLDRVGEHFRNQGVELTEPSPDW